jgi:hypothetical protein
LPEITPEQLRVLLEKLDAVCQQARELSDAIKRRMAQSARDTYPAPEIERRKSRRKPDA